MNIPFWRGGGELIFNILILLMLRLGQTRKSNAEALLGDIYLVTVLPHSPYNIDYLNIKK